MNTNTRIPVLSRRTSGFTIVELLIVIAIIAILAIIVVVAFNGIRTRAIDTKVKADLAQAGTKLLTLATTGNSTAFPQNFADTGLTSSAEPGGTAYLYNVSADGSVYCLQAINSGRTFFITNGNKNPQTGECDGTTGVPTDGNYTEEIDLSGSQSYTGLTSTNGASQIFTVTVPEGLDYAHFSLTGGTYTGSFGSNIRVRHGTAPVSGTYDCQSIITGNPESCYITTPAAGTWYVEVYLWSGSETYTGVTLNAEWGYWEGAYTGPTVINGDIWARQYYTVEVPAGTDYLSVWTANGTETDGGVNLAIKQGSRPGTNNTAHANSDCYSVSGINHENCYINNPTPGTWYIGIFGGSSNSYSNSTYANVDFQVDMGEIDGTYSGPQVISAGPWSRKQYTYTVPSGTDYISFTTYGGTRTSSGSNLAIKYNGFPGISNNPYSNSDCYSVSYNDNHENCFFYNPTPGTWYASVFSSSSAYTGTYDNVNFKIETGSWPGAYTAPVVLNGSYGYRTIYSYTVPAGKTSLTATLSGGTETEWGANLAVRYNALPGTPTNAYSDTTCYSHGTSNTESCVINNPTAGTWYISVFSGSTVTHASTFNNVTLTVTTAP